MTTQSSARTAAVSRAKDHRQDDQQQGHQRGQPAEATLRMRNVAHRLRFFLRDCGDGARCGFGAGTGTGTVAFGIQGETGDTGSTGPRHWAVVIHDLSKTRCLLFLLIGFCISFNFFIYFFFGYLALHFWHTDTLIWRHVCYLDLWYYLDLNWLNRNTWVGEIAGPNWLNYGLNCSPLNWQLALGSDNRCARTVIDKWHFRAEYRARRVFECEYEYGSEYECEYEYEYDEGAFKNPRPFSSHKHTRTHTLSPRVHSALWLCAYATRRSIGCGVHFYAALCAREVEAGQPDDAAYSQDWFACVSAWVFGSYVQAMLATDVGWHWHSVLRSIMAMDESVCLLPIGCVIVCVAGAEELQHPRLQLQFLLTLALLGLDSTRILWLVSRFWPCNSSISGHCSLFSVAFLRFVVRFALLLVN